MDKKENDLLVEINESLKKLVLQSETEELFSKSNKLIQKAEIRVENSLQQIQDSFDRIHDKLFNFNNILIGAYLVLGTFPNNQPKLPLWTVIFPVFNLIYLIVVDIYQMEIHRSASKEMEWSSKEREDFGKEIIKQTRLSLFAIILSLCCLFYIVFCLW